MITSPRPPKQLTLLEERRTVKTVVMPRQVANVKLDELSSVGYLWNVHYTLQSGPMNLEVPAVDRQ